MSMTPRQKEIRNGDRFGNVTVLEDRETGRRTVLGRCDCGTERQFNIYTLMDGRTRSCGCLQRRMSSELHRTHGAGYQDYRYRLWHNIRGKCLRENHPDYRYYGGRGITMSPAWADSYREFVAWLDANLGPRPDKSTLDRIDNEGNYEPGNLRWATRLEQSHNRRELSATRWWNLTPANLTPEGQSVRADYQTGRFMSYVELAEAYKISWATAQRIIAGLA